MPDEVPSQLGAEPKAVTLAYWPFPLTQAIHQDPHRFRVIVCGRRGGKTTLGITETFQMGKDAMEAGEKDPRMIVVAPTFGKVEEDWRIANQWLEPLIVDRNEADKVLYFGRMGQMDFRSADSQGGAARGGGYNAALLDEAAYIPEEVWERDVRPSLSDRRGRAVFISTPFGRNWFHALWQMAGEHPDYARWHYTTWQGWESRFAADPAMLSTMRAEWELIQATTSERTFQQEYLAEFLEGQGQFLNLSLCLRGQLRPALSGRSYVAGLDVAHVEDWMAIVVIEVESRQVVGMTRFRHRNWSLQKAETKAFLSMYPRVRVFMDATGLGDPIFQDLSHDLDVEGVVFTSKVKDQLVENMAVGLEHGYLGLPDQHDTQWLLEELRDFQETKTKAGNVQYGAPAGKHDDGVTALMLACWPLKWSWRQAIIPERPILPVEGTGLTMAQWDAMTEQSMAWRSTYPTISVPWHPRAKMRMRQRALGRFVR